MLLLVDMSLGTICKGIFSCLVMICYLVLCISIDVLIKSAINFCLLAFLVCGIEPLSKLSSTL